MTSLQIILWALERVLNANSQKLISILKINQTTYSAGRTGRHLYFNARHCNKFRTNLGIDLCHSMEVGTIIILNPILFKAVAEKFDAKLEITIDSTSNMIIDTISLDKIASIEKVKQKGTRRGQ